jgi:hypothetical protein
MKFMAARLFDPVNFVTTGRYAHLAIDPVAESAERISREIDARMKLEPRRLRAVK